LPSESAEKEVKTLPAEGLGVFPQIKKSPKIGGFRGLNAAFSVLCSRLLVSNGSLSNIQTRIRNGRILLTSLACYNGHAMTDSFIHISNHPGQARLVLPEPLQCFRCGECCRRYQVLLEKGEAESLAEYLGLKLPELKELYTDTRWPGRDKYLLRQGETGCPFLRQQGREFLCAVHEIKPQSCRDWTPGLDRRECREGLMGYWGLTTNPRGEIEGPAEKIKEFQDFLRGADA
jgi:Fe-S-cluster containining protein